MTSNSAKYVSSKNKKFAKNYWPTAVLWGIGICVGVFLIYMLSFLVVHHAPALDYLSLAGISVLLVCFLYAPLMMPVWLSEMFKMKKRWHSLPFILLEVPSVC